MRAEQYGMKRFVTRAKSRILNWLGLLCYCYYSTNIYRTVILPIVLCGYETWSLTLREEYRLRVFGNRVLRRVFGSKRDEVTGMEKVT
jgi:hypothetical protein